MGLNRFKPTNGKVGFHRREARGLGDQRLYIDAQRFQGG
jgi:hypothetical protein